MNRNKLSSRCLGGALVCVIFLGAACGGEPGYLSNEQVALGEISTEKQPVFVTTKESAMVRVNLDGTGEFGVHPEKYSLNGISEDGRIAVLGDSETNLYVLQVESGTIVRVPQLDGRVGSVSLSGDGAMLAVARHADFDRPQSSRGETEDDALYLVDTTTLQVRRMAPARHELVVRLFWSRDGEAIWLNLMDDSWQRFDVTTSQRELGVAEPDFTSFARTRGVRPTKCSEGPRAGDALVIQETDTDASIDLVQADGDVRPLIIMQGRERGFHDYQSAFSGFFFSNTCELVVFGFQDKIWVADVDTGRVSPLREGRGVFALPQ